jgi:hypothetical protein
MKANPIHPQKKQAMAHFFCFSFMAVIFGWLYWSNQDVSSSWEIVFPALFATVACNQGYRAFFFSNDWFRSREDQRADFYFKHPRIRIATTVSYWLIYLSCSTYLIWRGFFR